MNPHLKGHKSFAEMVAGHIIHWNEALHCKMARTTDRFDRAFIQHELNALADIKAACALEMEAAPIGGVVLHRGGACEVLVPHRAAWGIDAAYDIPGAANVGFAGMGQAAPECPKEPEVQLFGAQIVNLAVLGTSYHWVLMADSMVGHPRLGAGPDVRTSEVKEVWDFDGAIFARTKSGTLYKIMNWGADWIGSDAFAIAAQNFPCLQGLKA